MELHLVDPVPVAVVRPKGGRIPVRFGAQPQRVTAGNRPEREETVSSPLACLAGHGLSKHHVLLEQVAVLERWRLVVRQNT